MGNEVRIRASVDDKVSGPLGRIKDKFDNLGKSGGFKALATGVGLSIGQAAFNALGSAAGAAAGFIADSVQAASDLTEQVNKAEVVFGDASRQVEDFGSTSARSLGLSKRAAIEAAGTFGNLFTGVGKSQAEAAKMSTTLVSLAADLASFNNLDPGDVLDKLRSGLSGEVEPLRRVGVFLTEARVKAKAMELGLADASGEISEGAKITARYQLILEQTGQAQGDFARTSGSMANQQRILNAQLEDTEATLGRKVQPVVISAQRALIGLFDTIDAYTSDTAPRSRGEVDDMRKSIFDLGKSVPVTGDLFKQFALTIDPSLDDVSAKIGGVRDDWNVASHKITDYSGAMLDDVTSDNQKIVDSWNDLVAKLKSDVASLIDDVYDPTIERDQLSANKAEEASLRKILASAKSTAAEKRDARARLHELAKDDAEYYLKLLESGDITQSEYKRLLTSLETKSKHSTGKAKKDVDALIAKVKELYGVLTAGPEVKINVAVHPVNKSGPGKAMGGPVYKGKAYTVGEAGKETFVPSQDGYIVPHNATNAALQRLTNGMGGGGGPITIHLTFPGLVSAPTQAQAEQIGRLIAPAVADRMRARGQIAR